MKQFYLIWGGLCLFVAGFMFASYGVGSWVAWWNLVPGVTLLAFVADKLRAK